MEAHIRFCEPTYDVLPFVAEFWNTVSNASYFAVACVHWEQRYLAVMSVCVGVGSMLFHATQLRGAEYADEGAMLLLALGLLEYTCPPRVWNVVAWGTYACTLLYVCTQHYLWFVGMFGLLVLLLGVTVPCRAARLTMLAGTACWGVERAACAHAPTLFVCHGLWHVASAYSIAYVLVYIKSESALVHRDGELCHTAQKTARPARCPGERPHEVDREEVLAPQCPRA